MLRKSLVVCAGGLVGIAAGIAAAVILRGDFDQFILAYIVVLFVAAPLILLSILAGVMSLSGRRQRAWQWAAVGLFAAVVAIGAFAVVSVPLGRLILKKDIMRAQVYCKGLVPRIERHRKETGALPDAIDALLPEDQPLPRLLRESGPFYSHDNKTFTFQFITRDRIFSTVHIYRSDEGNWGEYD